MSRVSRQALSSAPEDARFGFGPQRVSGLVGGPAGTSACSDVPARAAWALFGLSVVLLAHISREKNLQCMEY